MKAIFLSERPAEFRRVFSPGLRERMAAEVSLVSPEPMNGEQVAACPESYTGQYLKKLLEK